MHGGRVREKGFIIKLPPQVHQHVARVDQRVT